MQDFKNDDKMNGRMSDSGSTEAGSRKPRPETLLIPVFLSTKKSLFRDLLQKLSFFSYKRYGNFWGHWHATEQYILKGTIKFVLPRPETLLMSVFLSTKKSFFKENSLKKRFIKLYLFKKFKIVPKIIPKII